MQHDRKLEIDRFYQKFQVSPVKIQTQKNLRYYLIQRGKGNRIAS